MHLGPSVRRELKRIAAGTLIGDVLLLGILGLLRLTGVYAPAPGPVFLGLGVGSVIAVGNFALLCLTVQYAVGVRGESTRKAVFQISYTLRLLVQGVWVVIALLTPGISVVAAAAPLLFPHGVILALRK